MLHFYKLKTTNSKTGLAEKKSNWIY